MDVDGFSRPGSAEGDCARGSAAVEPAREGGPGEGLTAAEWAAWGGRSHALRRWTARLFAVLLPPALAVGVEVTAHNWAVARTEEEGCFALRVHPAYECWYNTRVRFLVRLLADQQAWREGLVRGERTLADLEAATWVDAGAGAQAEALAQVRLRDAQVGQETRCANTALYPCPRCRSREVYMVEVQTRSADEPATLFLTCLSCQHPWRRGG